VATGDTPIIQNQIVVQRPAQADNWLTQGEEMLTQPQRPAPCFASRLRDDCHPLRIINASGISPMGGTHVQLTGDQISDRMQSYSQQTTETSATLSGQALQVPQQFRTQLITVRFEDGKVIRIEKHPIPVGKEDLPAVVSDPTIIHSSRQSAGDLTGVQARAKEALKGAFHQLLCQSFQMIESVHDLDPLAQYQRSGNTCSNWSSWTWKM
jgi:hypothetical protein